MNRLIPVAVSGIVLFLLCSLHLSAQENSLSIPYGSAPVIDGAFAAGEWDDAARAEISSGQSISIYAQHDGQNLYLAFVGPLAATTSFPEVMIDPDNARSSGWGSDDWWFHVSGSDCESQGKPSDYTMCAADHDDWRGVPNFSQNFSPDTVEIVIALAKINAGSSFPDTLGMAFDVTNTFSFWRYWPSTANSASPATWGTAVLLPQVSSSVFAEGIRRLPFLKFDLR